MQGLKLREVTGLSRQGGAQRRQLTKGKMQAWLVGRGEKEKIAKKVVELLYSE